MGQLRGLSTSAAGRMIDTVRLILILALASLLTAYYTATARPASTKSPTPTAIYRALLLDRFAEIPNDLAPAHVRYADPSAQFGRNALGAVEVNVNGPDDQDGILYIVTRSAFAAAGVLGIQAYDDEQLGAGRGLGTVPGYAKPLSGLPRRSEMWEFVGAGGVGNLIAGVAQGPVIVEGVSQSASSVDGGSASVAVRLVKLGLAHLARVERSLRLSRG